VLYEVIRALGQHNQNPKTKADDKIYIDVLTGASAGGMTATIAAQKLLYEAQSLAGEFTNAFYQPWVAEISIQRLLNLHGTDNERQSIFSSEAVAEISEKYITGRYASHLSPPPDPHPALDADHLKLGLAMSNLNGVDYSAQLRPTGQLTYTQFKDELITKTFSPGGGFSATPKYDEVTGLGTPITQRLVPGSSNYRRKTYIHVYRAYRRGKSSRTTRLLQVGSSVEHSLYLAAHRFTMA